MMREWINSYPMELDPYLSFTCDDLSNANNHLFQELVNMYNKRNKIK